MGCDVIYEIVTYHDKVEKNINCGIKYYDNQKNETKNTKSSIITEEIFTKEWYLDINFLCTCC